MLPRFVPACRTADARSSRSRRSSRANLDSARSRAWRSSSTHLFRVTRNADLELDEDEADDLLAGDRGGAAAPPRSASAVRLEVDAAMPAEMREPARARELEPRRRTTSTEVRGAARPGRPVRARRARPRPTSRRAPWTPVTPPAPAADERRAGRHLRGDPRRRRARPPPVRLVRRPRSSVHRRRRPTTRTCSRSSRRSTAPSGDSPIVQALIRAAERGKQVVGARRAQGALRRGGEHRLGAQRSRRPASTSSTAWSA